MSWTEQESKNLREQVGKWMDYRSDVAAILTKELALWEGIAIEIEEKTEGVESDVATLEADIRWLEEQHTKVKARMDEMADALDRLGLTPEDTDTD